MRELKTIIEPGLYQTNMGRASLKECWRLTRGYRFIYALLLRINRTKVGYCWLPEYEAIKKCDFKQFSNRTQENLTPEIEKSTRLGFHNGQCSILKNNYDDGCMESGSYFALHQDKKRYLSITYIYREKQVKGTDVSLETIALVYNNGFYDATDRCCVVVHNNHFHFYDQYIRAKVIYLKTQDLERITQRIDKEIQGYPNPIQCFQNIDHFDRFVRPLRDEMWLDKINRGLLVKVPTEEEKRILEKYALRQDGGS